MLPLGAAIPTGTVLKYGGYFPAGTSFPRGIIVPLHARLVNVLPIETPPERTEPEKQEGLCVIQ